MRIDISPRKTSRWPQACEKMLNITNHEGDAYQNHNEIPLHTCQNDCYSKCQQISVGWDMEKKEPSAPLVGCK